MPGFEYFGDEERKEVMDVLDSGVLMRYGFDAAGYDLALQLVEPLVVPIGQVNERDRLGHGDHGAGGERAEGGEAVHRGGSVGAGVTAAVTARVGERMLDRIYAPPFLIEHQVGEHAARLPRDRMRRAPFRRDRRRVVLDQRCSWPAEERGSNRRR